jgi:hypothetical protein
MKYVEVLQSNEGNVFFLILYPLPPKGYVTICSIAGHVKQPSDRGTSNQCVQNDAL